MKCLSRFGSSPAWLFLAFTTFIAQACTRPNPETSEAKIINSSLKNIDLLGQGRHAFTAANYELPAAVDAKVDADYPTDVRGRMYLPNGSGPFPLVVFLHGNHGTCGVIKADGLRHDDDIQFSTTGTCPDGWIESPSFLGYEYAATNLATHGYAVISINANRGITGRSDGPEGDRELIKARGALVLKHLARLAAWNKEGVADDILPLDIKGRIDFNHVGFMGHSRGGEGVRAAYDLFRRKDPKTYASEIAELNVEGILELAPVDGFADEKFNVQGTNWAVVIGTCDGDVKGLEGVDTFGRRKVAGESSFSSIFVLPGGNHNNFNSEWQIPETVCTTGEKELAADDQKSVSLMLQAAFFRGFVGAQKSSELQNVFDPQYHVPQQIAAYVASARESFDASMVKLSELANRAHPTPFKDEALDKRLLTRLDWKLIEGETQDAHYDTLLFQDAGDISSHDIVSLSLAPYMGSKDCTKAGSCADSSVPDLDISLIGPNGEFSAPVKLSDYVSGMILNRKYETCEGRLKPYGMFGGVCTTKEPITPDECRLEIGGQMTGDRCVIFLINRKRRLLFYEVPIELKDFGPFDLTKFVGLRLKLNRSESGGIYLDKTVIMRSNL